VNAPEPVYLQHMPATVAKRLDELYGQVMAGSVTVHKNDGKAVKFQVEQFEAVKAAGER